MNGGRGRRPPSRRPNEASGAAGAGALAPGAAQALAAALDGRECAGFALILTTRSSRTRSGWTHFSAALAGRDEGVSITPLVAGIASAGGRGVRPWVECRVFAEVEFAAGKKIDARALGLEKGVVEALAELIPPGGHLMVDYESGGQEETFSALVLGVPPLATHLGALLFAAGFRGQLKDWYFSEGGHEGTRKLQANRLPDDGAAREDLRRHRSDLRAFLKKASSPADPTQAQVIERAKQRAKALLATLPA